MEQREPLLDEMGTEMMRLLRTGDVMIYPDLVLTNPARAPRRVETTPLWDCYLRFKEPEPARPRRASAEPDFIGALLQVLSRLNTEREVLVLLDPEDERVLVYPRERRQGRPAPRRVRSGKRPSFSERTVQKLNNCPPSAEPCPLEAIS